MLNDCEEDDLNTERNIKAPHSNFRNIAIRTSYSTDIQSAPISPRALGVVQSTSGSLWDDISSVSMTNVSFPSPMFHCDAGSLLSQNYTSSHDATSGVYGMCDPAWSVLDSFPPRATDLLGKPLVSDFASSMIPVISHLFPRAMSSAHLVLFGDSTAIESAILSMSHPSALPLVREQSIDHQIIYMIVHHLINHEDVVRTLEKPKTKFDQILKSGITYCFSLGPDFLSSIIESTPSPYDLALIQSVFRAALFLGDGPILNVILSINPGSLIDRSVLLGDIHYYPVEYTSCFGYIHATEVLLDQGADPNWERDIFFLSDIGMMPWPQNRTGEARAQIMRLLIHHGLEIEPSSAVQQMEHCGIDELKVLVTYCLNKSFETFFDHQALPIVLLRQDWDDSLSDTLKTIIERASPDGPSHQKLWNSVLSESLSVAVLRSHAASIDVLLAKGAEPNVNCLVSAVLSNNLRIFKDILDLGLDPNAQKSNPFPEAQHNYYRLYLGHDEQDQIRTALGESIKHRSRGAFEILQARGYMSKLAHQPVAFVSAFIAACEIGDNRLVKQLLQLQSFPMRLERIEGALEAAVREDQHHLIEELLSLGIRPSLQCLHIAVQNRRLEPVKLLTSCMNIFDILRENEGHWKKREFFPGKGRWVYNNAILFEALTWGDQTAIDCVLRSGHPVNVFIHAAYKWFHHWEVDLQPPGDTENWNITPLSAAILKRKPAVVRALSACGAQIAPPHKFNSRFTSHQSNPIALRTSTDRADGWTLTPLAAAAFVDDFPLMEEFLRIGADPFDNSALFVSTMRDFEDAVTLLLSTFKTRYPDGAHSFGSDALYQTIRRKNMRLLRLLAIDTDITGPVEVDYRTGLPFHQRPPSRSFFTSPFGEALRLCCESDDSGASLDIILPLIKDHNAVIHCDRELGNMTGLLYAISFNSLEIVQKLHQAGANISLPAEWTIPRTPLQAAAQAESRDIMGYLLSHGVSPNEPPAVRAGATALQLAAITGSIGTATILLDAGADINAPPAFCDGRTAFEGATEHGRVEMMIFLVGEGADLLANGNEQYRRAVAFAEDNRQYAAKALADDLYAKLLANQQANFISMGEEWPGSDMPNFGSEFS